MFYNIFSIWLMLLILINIRSTNNSLLSRFRNPNEYVPRDVGKYFFPEDIDDDMYAELLQEVPELAGRLRTKQKEVEEYSMLPFIRNEVNGSFEIIRNDEEFDTEKDEDQEEYPGQLDYMTVTQGPKNVSASTERLPFLTQRSLNSSYDLARRQNVTPERFIFDPNDHWLHDIWYPRKARCYWCGMNHSTNIPISPLCHDAFESPDWRARTLARYFRAHCHSSWWFSESIRPYYWSSWTTYHSDNGLIRRKYGPYIGGCFKRFLDVGKVYTQRGCRSWWPKYTKTPNFASHRFTRLESLIRSKNEYCIVSPHASLTPFSRAISLYVRYHVCVCNGRYCNHTTRLQYSLSSVTSLILILIFMSF